MYWCCQHDRCEEKEGDVAADLLVLTRVYVPASALMISCVLRGLGLGGEFGSAVPSDTVARIASMELVTCILNAIYVVEDPVQLSICSLYTLESGQVPVLPGPAAVPGFLYPTLVPLLSNCSLPDRVLDRT